MSTTGPAPRERLPEVAPSARTSPPTTDRPRSTSPQTPARRSPTPEFWKRLATPQQHLKPLDPVVPRRVVTPDVLQSSVRRLYDQSIQRHKETLQKAEQSILTAERQMCKSPVMPAEDREEVTRRIYAQRQEEHNAKAAKIRDKYLSKSVVKMPHVDKAAEEAIVQRLYATKASELKASEELFEKHNPFKIHTPLRSSVEIVAMCDKYYKGGFAKKHPA